MKFKNWQKNLTDEIDLDRLEQFRIQCYYDLPDDFVEWLKISNGELPENRDFYVSRRIEGVSIHHIRGLNKDDSYNRIEYANEYLKGNINNPKLISFADDDVGNEFVVSLAKLTFGKIYYWEHETGKVTKIAKSIVDFDSKLTYIETDTVLDRIMRKDDEEALASWLLNHKIDERDEYDRTPIEEASIFAAIKCIKLLHSLGSELGDSLSLAEGNLDSSLGHQEIVDFLRSLEK